MRIWFWAWLLLAAVFAALELFDREREYYIAPWAVGSALAALLEALRAPIAAEWLTFVFVSSALLVGIQRFRAPSRRSLRKQKRRAA